MICKFAEKTHMFGLQMAHKGVVIYSALWHITAERHISSGDGCSDKLLVELEN